LLPLKLDRLPFLAVQLSFPSAILDHSLAALRALYHFRKRISLFLYQRFHQLPSQLRQFRFYRFLYLGQRRFGICLPPLSHLAG
jgi:hypothetical protein